jgi:hypothetical protein
MHSLAALRSGSGALHDDGVRGADGNSVGHDSLPGGRRIPTVVNQASETLLWGGDSYIAGIDVIRYVGGVGNFNPHPGIEY